MNSLKFRAFHKSLKGGLFVVCLIDFDQQCVRLQRGELFVNANFSEVELSRYTGIKDKNRVEIYEGDIVEYFENGYEALSVKDARKMGLPNPEVRYTGIVRWLKKECRFSLKLVGETNNWTANLDYCFPRGNKIKVLGNIFGNPPK